MNSHRRRNPAESTWRSFEEKKFQIVDTPHRGTYNRDITENLSVSRSVCSPLIFSSLCVSARSLYALFANYQH